MIEGRSRISLCLCKSLYGLVVICTHSDLSNVYIAVAHCDACHIFLLYFLTTGSELCYSTRLCGLGSLSACVGVNLGIEYHDVDILAACKYMVNTAESDIVCPSVTTEDPLGLLAKVILVLQDILSLRRIRMPQEQRSASR